MPWLERGGYDGLGSLGRGSQIFRRGDFSAFDVQQENGCGRGVVEVRLGGVVPESEFGEAGQEADDIQAAVLPALADFLFRNGAAWEPVVKN